MVYHFDPVPFCEMCGQPTTNHKILGQRLNHSQGLNPKGKEGISVSVKKCPNCDLIYSSPQPIPQSINDHYGIPPEEYWIEEYFKPDPNYFIKEITKAKELLNFKEGMKALDIGAGLGMCMLSLTNAGFDAYGLEPSETFRSRAISKMGICPNKLKLTMVEDADYPENEFDFITFGAVVEHLYHPAKSIEKAMKWLKPGGVIQIEVPNSNHLISRIINFYFRLRGTNYVTNLSPMHPPFHLYEFGIKSFEKLGKRLNFTTAESSVDVCTIRHMPKVLHPLLRYYMKRTNTGLQLTVWIRK